MPRLFLTLVLLAPLASLPGGAAASAELENLVTQALAAHPSVEAAQLRVDALEHRAVRALAWPEPVLGLEYGAMPLTAPYPGVHPMSGVQLRLQQSFPAPGTVGQRGAAAEARIPVAEASLAGVQVELAAAVRRTWWQLALTRKLRSVTVEHVALVEQLLDTVRASYEVGRAGQHDLLGLQVLAGRLTDDLGEFDRRERELLASLTAALAQDGELTINSPADLRGLSPLPDVAALVPVASSDNPSLRGLAAAADAERAAAATARREAWPDLTLWVGYRLRAAVDGVDEGVDQVSVGVSVPLPTATKKRWRRAEEEHEALARAADAEGSAHSDRIRADLEIALARWERAMERTEVYETSLIPAAQASLDAAQSAYRVGQTGFATLYQAEIQLLDLQRTVCVAAVDAHLAEVEVARLLGVAGRPVRGEVR
jgi:outer membrane protein, heavy metal efflux system